MNTDALKKIAKNIAGLSIDAIEAANSGHPGLPLGCAEIGAYLYGHALRINPQSPRWVNRDRFILSAGHGSMLLYSCLHLAGFDLALDDIKNFRQLHFATPGHPEFGETPGVEASTGPLGQGLAMAVGMALAHKHFGAQLDIDHLLDAKFYVLCGDGCMMEGVTSEASSLAGHLRLDNLIVIYDANDICLDGPTSECFTEDTAKRYESYGWMVQTIDGHNLDDIHAAVEAAKKADRPALIIAKTHIGKGAPSVQGTSEAHGKALGHEEALRAKATWGIPAEPAFYVDPDVTAYFNERGTHFSELETTWNAQVQDWLESCPEKESAWSQMTAQVVPLAALNTIRATDVKPNLATRNVSQAILQTIHEEVPNILGGSADLSCSDNTWMKGSPAIQSDNFSPKNIKYGVREFAMGAIANGIALQGLGIPFVGTFLTFSDYLRNAIRLAALMKLKVIYQFTHDSIFLGEDGPTHQPVEHLASLRAIPGLTVIRPADVNEVKAAWISALQNPGPTALILSRQGLPNLENSTIDSAQKGAYILKRESKPQIDYALLATGSEVSLALDVATQLEAKGNGVRVISFPSWELFEEQSPSYKASVMDGTITQFCSIEAQSSLGWHRYIGKDGIAISVDTFGKSAKAKDLAHYFGFTAEQIVERIIG